MREGRGERRGRGDNGGKEDIHLPVGPLDFFDYVETAVDDELVELSRLFGEARHAVAALFAGAKVILEQRIVLGADDGEVVAHDCCFCGGVWYP